MNFLNGWKKRLQEGLKTIIGFLMILLPTIVGIKFHHIVEGNIPFVFDFVASLFVAVFLSTFVIYPIGASIIRKFRL